MHVNYSFRNQSVKSVSSFFFPLFLSHFFAFSFFDLFLGCFFCDSVPLTGTWHCGAHFANNCRVQDPANTGIACQCRHIAPKRCYIYTASLSGKISNLLLSEASCWGKLGSDAGWRFDLFPYDHIVNLSESCRGGACCMVHMKLRWGRADGMAIRDRGVELHIRQCSVLAAGADLSDVFSP